MNKYDVAVRAVALGALGGVALVVALVVALDVAGVL